MKLFTPLVSLLLAACHTPPAAPLLPLPEKSVPEPRALVVTPATPPVDPKLQEQAKLIDSLLSQNDALSAQLAARSSAPVAPPAMAVSTPASPPAAPVLIPPPAAPPSLPPPASSTELSMLIPNAEGLIDVAAVALAQNAPEGTNPFAVRSTATDRTREVTLRLAGLIGGDKPCAIINDRRLRIGDHIESLTVARIDSDSVVFAFGEHRLRLPVADAPARVRLPL